MSARSPAISRCRTARSCAGSARPAWLDDPEVRLVDLDGDGVSDALRLGALPAVAYADPLQGWTALRRLRDGAPPVSLGDPRVKLADMTGDGLTDVVLVHARRIEYWAYRGYGVWDPEPVVMSSAQPSPTSIRGDCCSPTSTPSCTSAEGSAPFWCCATSKISPSSRLLTPWASASER